MILLKITHNSNYYDVGTKWVRNKKPYVVTWCKKFFNQRFVLCRMELRILDDDENI